MRALLGLMLVVGGLALMGGGIVDVAGKRACDESLDRAGHQRGADCESGTGTAILVIVGGAFVFFGGVALFSNRRRRAPTGGTISQARVLDIAALGSARSFRGERDYRLTVDLEGQAVKIKAAFTDRAVPARGATVKVRRRGDKTSIDP